MADKFKQERASNVTKPGEQPLDPDQLETRPPYPGPPPPEKNISPEKGLKNSVAGGSASSERDSRVMKPGEKPIDSELLVESQAPYPAPPEDNLAPEKKSEAAGDQSSIASKLEAVKNGKRQSTPRDLPGTD